MVLIVVKHKKKYSADSLIFVFHPKFRQSKAFHKKYQCTEKLHYDIKKTGNVEKQKHKQQKKPTFSKYTRNF